MSINRSKHFYLRNRIDTYSSEEWFFLYYTAPIRGRNDEVNL